jgi:hypothetical protein
LTTFLIGGLQSGMAYHLHQNPNQNIIATFAKTQAQLKLWVTVTILSGTLLGTSGASAKTIGIKN